MAGGDPARRESEIQRAAEVLRQAGFTLAIERTSGPLSAWKLAQAAVARGAEMVVVCGGDGTINEVINGVVPSRCPVAILPGGTANIAAKELGLPHDPVSAARALEQARPRRIALGKVTWELRHAGRPADDFRDRDDATPEALDGPSSQPSHRYFLSVAGVGFDAYVVRQVGGEFRIPAGALAYAWEAVRQVRRYTFPPFICRVDGRERQATFAVFQRAERYAGWLHLAPGGSLLDGRMRVCLFESPHGPRYWLYAAAVALRQHLKLDDVHLIDCQTAVCSAEDPSIRIDFELDGEFVGSLPARFEVVPDALTLLVPPG